MISNRKPTTVGHRNIDVLTAERGGTHSGMSSRVFSPTSPVEDVSLGLPVQ